MAHWTNRPRYTGGLVVAHWTNRPRYTGGLVVAHWTNRLRYRVRNKKVAEKRCITYKVMNIYYSAI